MTFGGVSADMRETWPRGRPYRSGMATLPDPAAIPPDTKNWTWVLERPCDECGFDSTAMDPGQAGSMLRSNADDWVSLLESAGDLRTRPAPDKWSPLEYGCHVRDVYRTMGGRLRLMLTQEDPAYPNWDQDATAVAERYGELDPRAVAVELRADAGDLADAFDAVPADAWERTGRRSDGARFTIATLSRYLLHDPIHHWYDATGERYGS